MILTWVTLSHNKGNVQVGNIFSFTDARISSNLQSISVFSFNIIL
uniref:Macaca fascicularis brain cDNA clone: QflA-23837, similar to human hypothetical protein LOC155006 (LOC155006), mRNA, RefSeq: XM_379931.1 n=1 Tax=Macaca fascicularis TaxID=9541 RepID=I7GDV3_MACFA|nr:unnamed protein product [Macaca fascicularis]